MVLLRSRIWRLVRLIMLYEKSKLPRLWLHNFNSFRFCSRLVNSVGRLVNLSKQRLRESRLCRSEVMLVGRLDATRWFPDRSSFSKLMCRSKREARMEERESVAMRSSV